MGSTLLIVAVLTIMFMPIIVHIDLNVSKSIRTLDEILDSLKDILEEKKLNE